MNNEKNWIIFQNIILSREVQIIDNKYSLSFIRKELNEIEYLVQLHPLYRITLTDIVVDNIEHVLKGAYFNVIREIHTMDEAKFTFDLEN